MVMTRIHFEYDKYEIRTSPRNTSIADRTRHKTCPFPRWPLDRTAGDEPHGNTKIVIARKTVSIVQNPRILLSPETRLKRALVHA